MLFARGHIVCNLCSEPVMKATDLFAAHTFVERTHPWYQVAKGVHWHCYAPWPERESFSEVYVEVTRKHLEGSGRAEVFDHDRCSLFVSPTDLQGNCKAPRVIRADRPQGELWFKTTGTALSFWVDEWVELWSRRCGLRHPLEEKALRECQTTLLNEFATPKDLLARVDVSKTITRFQDYLEANRSYYSWPPNRTQRFVGDLSLSESELRNHNLLLHEILEGSPNCPHCESSYTSLKYYDNRGKDRKSCVICQVCARSSRLEEFQGEIAF